jgi:hypothetical protein
MKFREHKGGLDESMDTVVEVADRDALVQHVRKLMAPWGFELDDSKLKVKPYAKDDRIGWPDTHLVTLEGYGVLGYTNGPL